MAWRKAGPFSQSSLSPDFKEVNVSHLTWCGVWRQFEVTLPPPGPRSAPGGAGPALRDGYGGAALTRVRVLPTLCFLPDDEGRPQPP